MAASIFDTPNIVDRAVLFATQAHHGQRRKGNGLPYVTHCIDVMLIVSKVPHTQSMLAAAVLHDVLEMTPTTPKDLVREFGLDVALYVKSLTDDEQGNRATRKRLSGERLSRSLPQVQTIKLADILSNTVSIVEHEPGFAHLYLTEKRDLLPMLELGDPALWEQAAKQIGL